MARIQQQNLHHSIAATLEVGAIPDSIYLLQEPYYSTRGKPGVRKPSNFFSKPRSRAAIYCSALKSFSFVQVQQFTDEDISVGIIEGGCLKHPVIVASIYLDYNQPSILPLMEELIQFCTSKEMKLICGIDCNAHSPLWGSGNSNKRGEELEEFIFQSKLFVHNTGNEPTWQARGQSSIIDITLSLNMEDDVYGWRVSNEPTASDHSLICYTLGSTQNEKILSRNYSKANWQIFREQITSNLKEPPNLWSESGLEAALEHLYVVIEKGLDQACPKIRVKKKDSIVWWNTDCENARNHYLSLRRKARIKLKRDKALPALLATDLKSAHKSLKYILRKAKRESFQEMVRTTNSVPDMSKLSKILDKKEASRLGLVLKPDGTHTSSTKETLEVMLDEHFPGNEPVQDIDNRSSLEGTPRAIDTLDWITEYRIKKAIQQFEPHKAAGPDGLRPIVLKNFPESVFSYLKQLFTACVEMAFTPNIWCHSTVLFMPKQGKKSYKEPRSFRPISLSSFLFKTLERLVVWQVEETALIECPLHPKQFAFRKNLSTEHALTDALNTIESALYKKKMVISIDLDIKGAFDNISTKAILGAMKKKKVSNNVISWYSDYLHHRTCEATLGASTQIAQLTRGCPQGGVASPVIAWNLPYDSLLEIYDGSAVAQFGFADDGKLIIIGCDYKTMIKVAQWALSAAEKWAGGVGVSFSPEKSSVMFFNRGMFQPLAETQLKLYGTPLQWSKATKYLGVTIDTNLSFRQHIENKIAAAKRKLMILGSVFRNAWGPHPKYIRWAYTGIVRPALAYGSIIWADKAQSETWKKKLAQVQRLALLQIAPVRRSTATASLELLYDIMPLHLFVWERALKTALRIGINPTWSPINTKGHQHVLLEALPEGVRGLKIDNTVITTIWEQNYEVNIGSGEDISRREWTCYTDGSKKETSSKSGFKSGSGGTILHNNQVYRNVSFSVGKAEVFQAELSAILACARILVDKGVSGTEIDFLVDSQAALLALCNSITTSDSVRSAKNMLNKLGQANEVKLHWIKAHVNWLYNELADANAKKGVDLEESPENIPLPSKRSVYRLIEDMMREKWVEFWDQQPCRQTKYFIGAPCTSRAKLLLKSPREGLGRLVRFLTGHAFLRRQNAIVFHDLNPPPGDISCRLCEDPDMEETPHHIITECERLCLWRGETLGNYTLDQCPQWDPQSLNKFLSHKDIILLETDDT